MSNEGLWNVYTARIELLEPLLGTIPKDRDVYEAHVRAQQAGDDETPTTDENSERGWTGFYSDEQGRPILFDYQFKGFLKEAGNTLKDVLGVPALRSKVEATVFVFPRYMVLGEEPDDQLERPLRAMTMQGPRVSVVRSDLINPGRAYEWELRVLKKSKVTEDVLRELLEFGQMKGLGQWRNGGYGRFKAVLEAS